MVKICVSTSGKNSLYRQKYVLPLMGNMFPLLGKQFLETKVCVSTNRNYVYTTGKIVSLSKLCLHWWENSSNRQKNSAQKICVSTNEKLISTTGKNRFYRQEICFEKIYFHFWKKTAFYRRLYVSTNRKYVSTTGKRVFTDKKCVFPLVGIMLALLKKQLHYENYVFPIA